MIALLLTLALNASHSDSPYDWHMSCERWMEKKIEILRDKNLDYHNKQLLIKYFHSKVDGECYDTMA